MTHTTTIGFNESVTQKEYRVALVDELFTLNTWLAQCANVIFSLMITIGSTMIVAVTVAALLSLILLNPHHFQGDVLSTWYTSTKHLGVFGMAVSLPVSIPFSLPHFLRNVFRENAINSLRRGEHRVFTTYGGLHEHRSF